MNIFEERIVKRYGLTELGNINGYEVNFESLVIKDGVPFFNYTHVLPSTIKEINVEFKFDFSGDDKS